MQCITLGISESWERWWRLSSRKVLWIGPMKHIYILRTACTVYVWAGSCSKQYRQAGNSLRYQKNRKMDSFKFKMTMKVQFSHLDHMDCTAAYPGLPGHLWGWGVGVYSSAFPQFSQTFIVLYFCYQWVVSEDPGWEDLRSLATQTKTHRLQSSWKVLLRMRERKWKQESIFPKEVGGGRRLWVRWLKSSTCSSRAPVPWVGWVFIHSKGWARGGDLGSTLEWFWWLFLWIQWAVIRGPCMHAPVWI
jgi:hypothetical protein